MNEPQQVSRHIDLAKLQKQSYEDSTNTKQQRKNDEEYINYVYPKWINDVFVLYLSTYDKLWLDTIPDKRIEHVKKLNWMEALQNFKPETILRAAKEARLKSPTYPPRIGEIYILCDEFSRSNRYNEFQIEHAQSDYTKPEDLSNKAKHAIEEIREFVRKQKNGS
jgi:hypothetical protein